VVAGYVISSSFFFAGPCLCFLCYFCWPGVALSLRRSLSCSAARQSRHRSLVVFVGSRLSVAMTLSLVFLFVSDFDVWQLGLKGLRRWPAASRYICVRAYTLATHIYRILERTCPLAILNALSVAGHSIYHWPALQLQMTHIVVVFVMGGGTRIDGRPSVSDRWR
jgi:hypothetical protein